MNTDGEKLQEWLEITNQQYQVLKIIWQMESFQEVKPKDIEARYRQQCLKSIQKTNLFGIIKILLDKKLIQKDAHMNYRIDADNIKKRLDVKQLDLEKEQTKIGSYIGNIHNIFKALNSNPEAIRVNLMDKNRFYNVVANKLRVSREYYNISRFPSIFLTETLTQRINRAEYDEVMQKECIINQKLTINYLTNLNIKRAYDHAKAIFHDDDSALKEVKLIIRKFKESILTSPKLQIYYSNRKPDWELIVPVNGYPNNVFLILRNKDSEAAPGILHIISEEVAERALEIMQSRIENAQLVTPENVNGFVHMLEDDLEKIHSEAQMEKALLSNNLGYGSSAQETS